MNEQMQDAPDDSIFGLARDLKALADEIRSTRDNGSKPVIHEERAVMGEDK